MNKTPYLTGFLIGALLILVSPSNLHGQNEGDPSLSIMETHYRQYVPLHQLLKNGREYRHVYPFAAGNQFVEQEGMQEGKLNYDGVVFSGLKMNYDTYNHLVVLNLFKETGQQYMILNPHKIRWFSLENRTFLNFKDSIYGTLAGGIYERLNPGPDNLVLTRHHKRLIKDFDSFTQKRYRFETYDTYYIIYRDKAYPIRSKKNLLLTLGEETELPAYIKQQKLKFKRKKADFAGNLVAVMEYLNRK